MGFFFSKLAETKQNYQSTNSGVLKSTNSNVFNNQLWFTICISPFFFFLLLKPFFLKTNMYTRGMYVCKHNLYEKLKLFEPKVPITESEKFYKKE